MSPKIKSMCASNGTKLESAKPKMASYHFNRKWWYISETNLREDTPESV